MGVSSVGATTDEMFVVYTLARVVAQAELLAEQCIDDGFDEALATPTLASLVSVGVGVLAMVDPVVPGFGLLATSTPLLVLVAVVFPVRRLLAVTSHFRIPWVRDIRDCMSLLDKH